MPPHIIRDYDESGDFVDRAMWDLQTPVCASMHELIESHGFREDRGWIAQPAPNDEALWAEWMWTSEVVQVCPLNAEHILATKSTPAADLCGWEQFGGILAGADTHTAVTQALCDRMIAAGLTGFVGHPLRVNVNQSRLQPAPPLVWLEITSRWCMRRHTVVTPPGNACPFCGWGPIVCPGCGEAFGMCDRCNRNVIVNNNAAYVIRGEKHQGPGDPRYIHIVKNNRTPLILNGSEWDGSDFVFLIDEQAWSFLAKPVRVDVRGASAETLRQLKRATARR